MRFLRSGLLPQVLVLALATAPAQAWFFNKNHPSETEIVEIFKDEVPDYLVIDDIDIGSQEERQGFTEYSESRVQIKLHTNQPLYKSAGFLDDETRVIETATPAGAEIVAYAIVEAVAIGEGWDSFIKWDDAGALKSLGRIRAVYPVSAVELNSPAHLERVALLKEQAEEAERQRQAEIAAREKAERELAEAKAREFAQLQKDISGTYAGMVTCGRQYFEIGALTVDAASSTAALEWRKIVPGRDGMTKDAVTVQYDERQNAFFAPFGKHYFALTRAADTNTVQMTRGCEAHMYPADAVPAPITAERDQQAAILSRLAVGPVEARAFEGGTEVDVNVEVLEIRDREVQLRVAHPMRSSTGFNNSGKFNNNMSNLRTSTFWVTFADAPAPLFVSGTPGKHSRLVVRPECGIRANATDSGWLRIEENGNYGCQAGLELKL